MGTTKTIIYQVTQLPEGVDLWQIVPAVAAATAALISLTQTASGRRGEALRAILQRASNRPYQILFWNIARTLGYSDSKNEGRFFTPAIWTTLEARLPWVAMIESTTVGDERRLGEQAGVQVDSVAEEQIRDLLGPGYSNNAAADFVTFYDLALQLAVWVGASSRLSLVWRRVLGRPPRWVLRRSGQILLAGGTGLLSAMLTHRYLAAHIMRAEEPAASARDYRAAYGVTDQNYSALVEAMLEAASRAGTVSERALSELRRRDAWVAQELGRTIVGSPQSLVGPDMRGA